MSLVFNMRGGLRTKLAESDFLDLFLDKGMPRYDVVGLSETHDINDSFDFPGYDTWLFGVLRMLSRGLSFRRSDRKCLVARVDSMLGAHP